MHQDSGMKLQLERSAMVSLLERSAILEEAAKACFPATGVVLSVSDNKHELVAAACTLCIEHGRVLRSAFALDAPSSGSALLRLQYEALLRAAWLMFAATDTQFEKLASALNVETEQAAKNLPGYSEMLNAVLRAAPEGLGGPLEEFNQYSRQALNSFVHSGIHALHRMRNGYPAEMARTVVQFSNGLLHFAYRLLASLSGSQRRMDRVTRLNVDFSDCLPKRPA
jgi:hypothetical protein